MRDHPLTNRLLALAGAATILVPLAVSAQVREVVSKQVSVGRTEASLRLEFADHGTFAVVFEDGVLYIGDETVGQYEPGGGLEAAWRGLLGQAVALDDGPLAQALSEWRPPDDLTGAGAELAARLDRAIETALSAAEPPARENAAGMDESERSLLRVLLSSTTRLGVLERALRGVDQDVVVRIDEDVVIGPDEVVNGTLVVIGGDARVEGEVEGDVVVIDGSLDLRPGGHVHGDVRLADASLSGDEDVVEGSVVDVLEETTDMESQLRDRIRTEVRSELRDEVRRELRAVTRDVRDGSRMGLLSPLRPVFAGVGGLVENLVTVLILALVGAGVVAFQGEKLDNVAAAARQAPGRAAVVGLAGTFLLVPVWILGTIALCVSIVGIPALVAWVPLFPLAAAAAAVLGYLAVARNAGEWLADSGYPWTDWIRKSNPIYTMLGGLVGLMLAFMAANVIGIAPFLGVIAGLLVVVGSIVTFLAVEIGFGAVLLTRAGRRREYWPSYDAEAAWREAVDIDVEEPSARDEDAAGSGDQADDPDGGAPTKGGPDA